jgi:hypothetical protein
LRSCARWGFFQCLPESSSPWPPTTRPGSSNDHWRR